MVEKEKRDELMLLLHCPITGSGQQGDHAVLPKGKYKVTNQALLFTLLSNAQCWMGKITNPLETFQQYIKLYGWCLALVIHIVSAKSFILNA